MGTIVVGIDGSTTSWEALTWATREALLRGADLKIIHAWMLPPAATVYMAPDAQLEATAKVLLDEAAERVKDQLGAGEKLEVVTSAFNRAIAPTLIEQSEGAEMLVVGSRGHGAFMGMLLGSVGLHCATHARCPVVIVHPDAG